jgi:hypothetical protein
MDICGVSTNALKIGANVLKYVALHKFSNNLINRTNDKIYNKLI